MRDERFRLCSIIRSNAAKMLCTTLQTTSGNSIPNKKQSFCGMCGLCSLAIETAFKLCGYDAVSYIGLYLYDGKDGKLPLSHCWTESDGYIYDVTASQFGKSDIFISKTPNLDYHCKMAKITLEPQSFVEWSMDQKPTPEKIQQLLQGIGNV